MARKLIMNNKPINGGDAARQGPLKALVSTGCLSEANREARAGEVLDFAASYGAAGRLAASASAHRFSAQGDCAYAGTEEARDVEVPADKRPVSSRSPALTGAEGLRTASFLIETRTIRNRRNSLKTKDGSLV